MSKAEMKFEADVYISPQAGLAGLVLFSLILIFASDYLALPSDPFKATCLGVLIWVISLAVWLISRWRPKITPGSIIIALIAIIFVGVSWLETQVFLVLVIMPVAVAAILSGFLTAVIAALVESLFLFLLPIETDLGSLFIILFAIWVMVALIFAVSHPLQEITHWSWGHFKQAQDLLEEARDRKVELHQALDDLAHAYRELALLNERVTAMRLVAEEAQAAKTAFVAKVSHEFRTPLNMIIGLTDVLMDTPEVYGDSLSPALLDDLKIVHRNCEHLSKMVNDILDLSQTEVGRLTLRREWTDLAEDIDTALTTVRPLLEKKLLSLQVNLPVDLPQVYCDRTRISQVILNLVSNATRFTDQGGITVSVRQQEQHLVISIADTGPGVLPEDAERIFEPFCQGSGNPWRGQKGSGLGLSISKQFVELHGGQMWLESQPGRGSTFSFKLPIAPPASPSATVARWINQNWVWHERTSKSKIPQLPYKQRVLICDEMGDLYDQLTHCSDEIEFIKVDNLDRAVHEAQAVPAHVVVINTASNPHPEPLLEQAKRDLPDTPIIMGAFPSYTKHVFEAGAINYLIKPIMRVDLEKALNALGQPVKCVLIADDDPDLRQLLRRMLSIYDPALKVITASSGEEALTQLRRHAPDLILIDIIMPDMDGWQTLERKKQDESIKDIPAIIISAQDPASQPMLSQTLAATMGRGISADKFLRCSLELSTLLLEPD
jgi:signal transduction histidine kinase/CheY-like chemotaxis protein